MCVCLCRRGGLGVEGGKCYSSFPCVFFGFMRRLFSELLVVVEVEMVVWW